jgi:polyhydroxybutyrate depolymerase
MVALALGGAALGACAAARSASPAAPAAALAAAHSPGCGRTPSPGPTVAAPFGDVPQSITVDGSVRTYRLAVPAHYRPGWPTPLILQFHGSGSDALQQSAYSGLPAAGAAAGYLVATPDAVGGTWDLAAPGSSTADQRLVAALESDLAARYCVDRTRIYAAGISLGSEFATIVACDPADRIAAAGLVAAEYLLRPCPGPVDVLAFHGTADPIVPYATGATGRSVPGVPVVGALRNLEAWARLDRCRPTPTTDVPAPDIVRRQWSGCSARSSVVLYTVVGGGHTWPGSPVVLSSAAFGPTTGAVSATRLMLRFFGDHPAR